MTYNQVDTALTKLVSAARDMDTAYAVKNLHGKDETEAKTAEYLRIRNSILEAFEQATLPKVWHGSGVYMGPGEEPGR